MVEKDAATRRVADRYIATWNEPDARGRAIADLVTLDGTYTDPLAAVQGHEAKGP